jgi:hypothetical protein
MNQPSVRSSVHRSAAQITARIISHIFGLTRDAVSNWYALTREKVSSGRGQLLEAFDQVFHLAHGFFHRA